MLYFRVGTGLYRLLTVISIVGEYPVKKLELLGTKRSMRELVLKLTRPQIYKNMETGDAYQCELLSVSGKGSLKTIRLRQEGLQMLHWLYPGAYDYYMMATNHHTFSGTMVERIHRIAEALAIAMMAGYEIRPGMLPSLLLDHKENIISYPSFYTSIELKQINIFEIDKTQFSRMVGALIGNGCGICVYNIRSSKMKWRSGGEIKARVSLESVCKMNSDITDCSSCIMIGESEETAMRTMMSEDPRTFGRGTLLDVYRHIHFIPLSKDGIIQLTLMNHPLWREKLLDAFFRKDLQADNSQTIDCDAVDENGLYILNHMDADLVRLRRFYFGIEGKKGMILCFEHQREFLEKFMEGRAMVRAVEPRLVENAMKLKFFSHTEFFYPPEEMN